MTRHSKQIPIPHSGPRGSPVTDLRNQLAPDKTTAADTMVPAETVTFTPFTESVTESCMLRPPRKVRLDGYSRGPPQDLVRHKFPGGKRRGDPQAFVSGGKNRSIGASPD